MVGCGSQANLLKNALPRPRPPEKAAGKLNVSASKWLSKWRMELSMSAVFCVAV